MKRAFTICGTVSGHCIHCRNGSGQRPDTSRARHVGPRACRSRCTCEQDPSLQEGGTRGSPRPHRAVPRRPARADLHGFDVSTGNRRSGALVQGTPRGHWRCGRRRGAESDLGPEREIAVRIPERAHDDEREDRLDAEARRRLPRAAEGSHADRAGPAEQGQGHRQSQEQQGSDGQRPSQHRPARPRRRPSSSNRRTRKWSTCPRTTPPWCTAPGLIPPTRLTTTTRLTTRLAPRSGHSLSA